jgi:glycosyltransferase involved in cell wall biosynthesis
MSRPRAALGAVAWTTRTDRAVELADALGGAGVCFGHAGMSGRWTAPLRYVVNTVRTALWLGFHRPRTLIVQNPPIVLAGLGFAWSRLAGAQLVLDSHPISFGRKQDRIWRLFGPIHRAIARRAALVFVTVEELADEVRGWGGRPVLVHEAPPPSPEAVAARPRQDGRPVAFFVCVFEADEPVEEVVAAAEALPGVTFQVTGDLDTAAERLGPDLPPNVELVGFLGPEDYAAALASADVVLALTTESTSVVRAAYEAVYAKRPLIVSDWPELRSLFPHAVPAGNTGPEIAQAVEAAVERREPLLQVADRALEAQEQRWEEQLRSVRAELRLD